ncbi:hypothetical protein TSUD_135940 [Trifolium subterraneum]|uniref:Uncharacterized protein n=1 Tax=Trifolium subterraneum TaxID=3900 RepID=A0A2Z6PER0_TRISU|nr:hypothetical protein TSUD_135940 [Trifolium subterraneum]
MLRSLSLHRLTTLTVELACLSPIGRDSRCLASQSIVSLSVWRLSRSRSPTRPGSVWIVLELKGRNEDCAHFEEKYEDFK